MGKFKEKVKTAYKHADTRSVKVKDDKPYYYKLAKTAMRAGQVAGVLTFLLTFYVYDMGVLKSALCALLAFILIQPIIGVTAVLLLKDSKKNS